MAAAQPAWPCSSVLSGGDGLEGQGSGIIGDRVCLTGTSTVYVAQLLASACVP
jgi:hypothetical protein